MLSNRITCQFPNISYFMFAATSSLFLWLLMDFEFVRASQQHEFQQNGCNQRPAKQSLSLSLLLSSVLAFPVFFFNFLKAKKQNHIVETKSNRKGKVLYVHKHKMMIQQSISKVQIKIKLV